MNLQMRPDGSLSEISLQGKELGEGPALRYRQPRATQCDISWNAEELLPRWNGCLPSGRANMAI